MPARLKNRTHRVGGTQGPWFGRHRTGGGRQPESGGATAESRRGGKELELDGTVRRAPRSFRVVILTMRALSNGRSIRRSRCKPVASADLLARGRRVGLQASNGFDEGQSPRTLNREAGDHEPVASATPHLTRDQKYSGLAGCSRDAEQRGRTIDRFLMGDRMSDGRLSNVV